MKKLNEYNTIVEKIRKGLELEQYAKVACDNPKDYARGVRLSKQRFKQFL